MNELRFWKKKRKKNEKKNEKKFIIFLMVFKIFSLS